MTAAADQARRCVLVVDDHRIFGEVIAARLRSLPRIDAVDVATTVEEAMARIRVRRPDLVLLDYHLGDLIGLDLLSHLGAHRPPVAIISSNEDPEAVGAALQAGVAGWLVKHARVTELLTACELLLAGEMVISPRVLRPLMTRLLDPGRGGSRTGTFVDDLSPRELEVLRCLVAGLDRAQVAQRLYLSPNTVRTHVQRLFKRAGVHSSLALIAQARAAGVTPVDREVSLPGQRASSG